MILLLLFLKDPCVTPQNNLQFKVFFINMCELRAENHNNGYVWYRLFLGLNNQTDLRDRECVKVGGIFNLYLGGIEKKNPEERSWQYRGETFVE